MPRLRRSVLVATVVAVAFVGIGIWMIVAGWPLQTPAQETLLDLSQLPMSAAVLVAIAQMTYERRLWRRRPVTRFAAVFGPGAVLTLAGLVLVAVAFGLPNRTLVGPGQLLIWTGLGIAFLYLAVDSVRGELRRAKPQLVPLDDDLDALWDDDEDEDLAEAAEDEGAAYGSYRAPRLLDGEDGGTSAPGTTSLQ